MQFKKFFHDIIDQPKVLGTDKDQKPLRSFWPVMTSSKSCIIAQMPKPGVLQEVIMSHRNMHINIWLIHMKDQLKISVYARNQIQVTSYNGEMTSSKMLISSKLKSSLRTRNIWYMYIIQYQIKFAVELTLKKCNLHNIEMRRWAKIDQISHFKALYRYIENRFPLDFWKWFKIASPMSHTSCMIHVWVISHSKASTLNCYNLRKNLMVDHLVALESQSKKYSGSDEIGTAKNWDFSIFGQPRNR